MARDRRQASRLRRHPPPVRHAPAGTVAGLALALAGYVVAISIVFRGTILSGFDLGFGNRSDAMIEISILEHWRSAMTAIFSPG